MIGKHERDLVGCEQSPRKQKSLSSRKKVTFATVANGVCILSRHEYSVQEKVATWYTPAEFRLFKQERLEIARIMSLEVPCDDICTRGLEALTTKGARQRSTNIAKGIKAVLDEQELQEYDGEENPEMLAHIYKLSTKKSITSALKRGEEYRNND